MKNPRLIYRVILKVLSVLALIVLLVVFLNSLFVSSPEEQVNKNKSNEIDTVVFDISALAEGDVKKARWNGKEVAVLHRKPNSIQNSIRSKQADESLDELTRSQKPKYFVFVNYGDSRNCPLFYAKSRFKDICSSTFFDNTGRPVNNPLQGFQLEIPPHYFNGEELVIGRWGQSKAK